MFNVPAGLVTAPGKVFVQEQLTFTAAEGEANATAELGLTRWLEVGFNAFHVPLYASAESAGNKPFKRAFSWNASVSLAPRPDVRVFLGGSLGVGERPSHLLGTVGFGWAVARWEAPGRFGTWIVGAAMGNRGAEGEGAPFLGILGAEVPIIPDRVAFLGDWFIGNNDVSVAVLGAVVFIGPSFQICGGAQLPSPGSRNDFGGVLELTWVPVDATHPGGHVR